MKEEPTSHSNFSRFWFLWGFMLHFLLTAILGGLAFLTGMMAFKRDVDFAMSIWEMFFGFWTPLAAAHHGDPLLAFVWSLFVGVVIGFIAPRMRKSR